MEMRNLPSWAVRNTIFYVDAASLVLVEMELLEAKGTDTVQIQPVYPHDGAPEAFGRLDIGREFFWSAENASEKLKGLIKAEGWERRE